MKPVLIDTSVIVALLDRSEAKHKHCVSVMNDLHNPLVTCEAVIAESCYLLRKCSRAGEVILANISQGVFLIPFRLVDRVPQVSTLLKRYSSVPMALADGCLVDMANQLTTGEILTLDRDFEVYRWQKNKRFEILI